LKQQSPVDTDSGQHISTSAHHHPHDLEQRLREQFPEAVEEVAMTVDFPTFTVAREQFLAICRFVRDTLGFDAPQSVNGIDRGDRFEVVYHLYSMQELRFLGLKVKLNREEPRMPSATAVWRGVNWHEREVFDMFGVIFDGHPDLRRILLPDDWVGHPARKDYKEID
jgi:NADH-quinone oxidoreductase subunit C